MPKPVDQRLTARDRGVCLHLWDHGPLDTEEIRLKVFDGSERAYRRLPLLEQGGYLVRSSNYTGVGGEAFEKVKRLPDLWDVTLKGAQLGADFDGRKRPEKWEPRRARKEPS